MERILVLLHPDAPSEVPRLAREVLGGAVRLREACGGELVAGLIGADVRALAGAAAGVGAAHVVAAVSPELAASRYGSDLHALDALVTRTQPTIILAPGTPRMARALPGLAARLGAPIDTHVTGVSFEGPAGEHGEAGLCVERWYYRQRIRTRLTRAHRPWILCVDGGVFPAWDGEPGTTDCETFHPFEEGALPAAITRTRVLGEEAGEAGSQTIRPEADLLLVAGAGWAKKQADGQTHTARADELIQGFLSLARASLGSSKSLVDQTAEGHAVLGCLSHLNQVGQTGSTPRHPKGLATCCHGEEPHVVGWRFIQERRAINLDANCGWARGKADVVYVADAFEVMAKVNERLARSQAGTEPFPPGAPLR